MSEKGTHEPWVLYFNGLIMASREHTLSKSVMFKLDLRYNYAKLQESKIEVAW